MITIPDIRRLRTGTRIFGLIAITLALAALLDLTCRIFVPGGARSGAIVQNSVPVATVSAASFLGSPTTIAKNSIVAAFGTQLATGVQGATPGQPLPTTLLSTNVTVNDTVAQLFFVSPNQINYLVPPNVPDGDAQVVVTMTAGNGDQIISSGQIKIASFTPSIFTAGATGSGPPAAVTGRVNSNGVFVFDPTAPVEPDPVNPGQFLPRPIDVGTAQLPAFLILFCTGAVNAPAGSVKAVIGGLEVPVNPVPAPGFAGLDQINIPIPVELKGRGIVDLSIVTNGVSSNTVIVNMAGNPASGLNIANFSVIDGAIAGQTITINGAGFSTTPNQNLVRFGGAQGQVVAATATQLTVIVPFNAESGQVMVQTPQGEARSSALFKVRTSISGLVQSTGTATSQPAPLEGVTIRVVGRNISVQTNPQGTFVIPDLDPGVEQVEIDGNTVSVDPPYPRVALKATILPNRDNQFPQPISLQQIVGGGSDVGGSGTGFASDNQSSDFHSSEIGARVFKAIKHSQDAGQTDATLQPSTPGLLEQIPVKTIAITHRGVTLEIPLGTGVRFPDGKSQGQLQLTVLEGSRLPGIKLPTGIYSSNIAQITPLGTQFSPGCRMIFANPDQSRLAPGAKVDLYRFDPRAGSFIKRGTATVTADRARVVSDGLLVDLASFWLAAAPSGVTTVTGRVTDPSGSPIAGAQVSANGHSDISDLNGGFSIADVATAGVGQIRAEAVLPRQFGAPPRGASPSTNVVAGGTTKVGTIILNINQTGLALSPFAVNFVSNALAARIDVTLTEPAPSGGLIVTLASNNTQVATVPANITIPAGRNTVSFNVTRVGPGVASITASATVSTGVIAAKAVVTIARPAPRPIGVSPASAPAGAKITITGSGFNSNPRGNTVGFIRNRALIAVIDPAENEIAFDTSNALALRVEVPDIVPGAVQIVVSTIDNLTGVISDPSAPLNFTVARPDLNTPSLTAVSPAQGKPRDQIAITGSGFSVVATENLVTFRQGLIETQARVVRSSATQLFVEVPSANIGRGRAAITVRRALLTGGRGALSNALDFTITEEPRQAPRPTLTAVNVVGGGPRGRDGNPISATGAGFGRNFLDARTNGLANDEPLISMLLFHQNNTLVNFAFPTSATGGTQLTAVIPTGLNEGPIQITTTTFDLESGLVSEESAPVSFTITVGSLRRVIEDEPNDSFKLATKVLLQSIVDGRAAEDDPSELVAVMDNGDEVPLVDFFQLTLDKPTQITFTLTMAQTADLDLFLLRETEPGVFEGDISATRKPGSPEQLGGPEVLILPAGEWFIAV
ncbi:MAG TPA: IPT/TIG domain-containing protein, partial [Blastocatellia bacterium]|nr:IPT/TIG domain-containing protein [Blastocatellia bacterium]